uniref:Peptidyl-prolyl cis-trans isomerase n=1 Tax=Acrobeloides nanus TaxID=290746 RepID=A0A914E1K9_9BILA
MSVLIETTLGDVVIDLFIKERMNTCRNFIKLCKIKYYNLCRFHTIETNYIAQTGDPTNTGRGGESIFGVLYGEQARYFEMELLPKLKHTRRGIVSMVGTAEGLLGSQFFITLDENLDYLDDKHCIFGQVTEGFETLQKLNEELCDENHKPYRDIRISHTIILHDPFEDPPRLPIPDRSPLPGLELVTQTNIIALDQALDEDEGKTDEQIKKEMEEKEMKAQAQILEMVGDLHYADEKPPDNVLFVCKLNPVTTDDDLEVIFSRFGPIKCCEVIRDRRTSASLQYAFIEFEKPEHCEAAFLKMDNVLIDDRRIHVDFSQSVAKNFQWKRQMLNEMEGSSNQLRKKRDRSRSPDRSRESRETRRKQRSRSRSHGRRRSPSRSSSRDEGSSSRKHKKSKKSSKKHRS